MLRSGPAGGNQSAQLGTFNTLTVTGQGLFADGTAAAPSIAFTNAPTTGFFRPAGISVVEWSQIGSARGVLGNGVQLASDTAAGFAFSGTVDPAGTADTMANRDSAGVLGIYNSIAMRGGAGFGMRAISGSYSAQTNDFTICCSTATQGFTVLLPTNPAMNQYLNIKKVSGDANRLIIDGNGNLIDALSTQSTILQTRPNIALQFGSTVGSPTGSAWQIL